MPQNPSPDNSSRTGGRLAEIAKLIEGRKLPPIEKWHPDQVDPIDIRIARDGAWYYQGTPIGRKKMVNLFSSVLRKEGSEFYLVTPVEKLRIEVEDAPFVAVEMEREGRGRRQTLAFRTNTEDWVIADRGHPIRVETDPRTGEPSPYVLVRARLEALIARPVFYRLVEIAERRREGGKEVLGVWSRGAFFPLGAV